MSKSGIRCAVKRLLQAVEEGEEFCTREPSYSVFSLDRVNAARRAVYMAIDSKEDVVYLNDLLKEE